MNFKLKAIKKIALIFVFGVATINAFSQAKSISIYEPAKTVLRDDIRYKLNADGTYVYDEFETIRINNDIGIKAFGHISIPYSSSLQELEILEAYTTTKSGNRIDVSPDKIFIQESAVSSQAPMFDDLKVKNIVFPAVEVGTTITFHQKRIQKTALIPGEFSTIEVFNRTIEFKSAQISIEAPDSLKLFAEAINVTGGEIKSEKPGVRMWHWSIDNTIAHAPEFGSVGPADYSPRVAVTTFSSYNDAAYAYLARSKDKVVVTPAIQRQANEITMGISDKRAQAKAIYQWVSKSIRYVAIFLNSGSVVPHDADAIVEAKYGDCKDHVTLLEALLAAKNIKSEPVIVNATNGYWLPKVAAFPGVLNHAITYIPEFDLYVDSTAQFAPFGVLPVTEQGKSALELSNDGQAKLVILPSSQGEIKNNIQVNTRIEISDSGDIKGQSKINNEGVFELTARTIASSIPKGMEEQVAGQVLISNGQHGSGSYEFGDPGNPNEKFIYSTNFLLPNFVHLPGPGAISFPVGLGGMNDIATIVQSATLEKRDFDVPCSGGLLSETMSIKLPDTMKITGLPKSTNLVADIGHYESTYNFSNGEITIKRTLDLKMPAVCTSLEYAKFHEMASAMAKDLRAQILYQ